MLTLLIDPQQSYKFDPDVIQYTIDDVPKAMSTAGELLQVINTGGFEGTIKKIVFLQVDKLSNAQAATLSTILYGVRNEPKVVLTANVESEVDENISNLGLKVILISRGGKVDTENIYTKLLSYLNSRRIPESNDLYIMLRVFGHSPDISEHNRDLACELDTMLFKTSSDYLATVWAGLHEIQRSRIKLVFPKKKKIAKKVDELTPRKYANQKKKKTINAQSQEVDDLRKYF